MQPTSPQLDLLLSRLTKVQKRAGGYVARCPVHDDHDPTLSVADGERAVVLWCWTGCNAKDILAAVGLSWSDVFYEKRNGYSRHAPDQQPAASKKPAQDRRGMMLEAMMAAERLADETNVLGRLRVERGWAAPALYGLKVGWDGERLTVPVADKDGKPHDVLRYDPFGRGRAKMLAGEGKSRLPWPAPENRGSSRGWPFVLVEGEGTAISLASIGVNATALPGAVSRPTGDVRRPGSFRGPGWHYKWTDRFSEYREILLIPDCDESGHTLMRTVSYDLAQRGHPILYLDLKLAKGEDVGDVLRVARTGEARSEVKGILKTMVECARSQPDHLPDALAMLTAWREYRS